MSHRSSAASAVPGKCPDCRTADLAYGRKVCQSCMVLRILRKRGELA